MKKIMRKAKPLVQWRKAVRSNALERGANQIRFSQLVEKSGQPEAITLWENPKQNRPFMKAVQDRRVVTVIQKPTGTKKDFGVVGFQQQPFALYLVFPKVIRSDPDDKIIGINYDLIHEPKVKASASTKAPKPSRTQPTAKPIEKRFTIRIVRTAIQEVEFNLAAKTKADAKKLALDTVESQPFALEAGNIRNEVKILRSINPS